VAEAMSVTTGQPVRVPAPRQQYADDARTMTTMTTTMTTVNQTADTTWRAKRKPDRSTMWHARALVEARRTTVCQVADHRALTRL